MPMLRKTITISETMEDWIKSQIETGRYGNDSEYMRDLIRKDQDRVQAEAQLRGLIQEGLESGVSDAKANDIKARVKKRLNADGRL